ncbi:MAG: hypothetical protein K6U14_12350 [Firmicutes bacterium]|nr:hypothetical protein [Alicyclobacillaceae bacterium]MCL6498401.1 hypothetical protein [Bacillota bacterium]
MARWAQHRGIHVYHYNHGAVDALQRLAGRHGTREAAVDRLLRGEVLGTFTAACGPTWPANE